MGVGVLLFSKIVDYLLENYDFQTRYGFLGLILGTVPLFYREVRKNGFRKRYYLVILAAAAFGFFFFGVNRHLFPAVTEPNLWQSMLLGVAVAGSSIVPGVDSAVILSALGLYELYVSALADFNLQILIPAALGVAVGALVISAVMNLLLKKAYTGTFSVVFGMFLSIIPNMLNEKCAITSNAQGIAAVLLVIVGFCISFYLGDIKGNNERIKAILNKRK
jgi:putative membrane protein